MRSLYSTLPPKPPAPGPADEMSLPRHPALKLLFWSSTALFIGFSLGILTAHVAAMSQPKCIDGKSEIVAGGSSGS